LQQDEDVLDTWFSSWLWPFTTLGWDGQKPDANGCLHVPEHINGGELKLGCNESDDFKRFYPTSALLTGYDIIFFWVSRMIMAGLEFTGKAPFRDIFLAGLVRDKKGRKMSKSLGNGIDPLDVVKDYGADALKFTLAFLCAQGQDILIDKESFKVGSKFANKVWNASRYIMQNLEGRTLVQNPGLAPADKWIYSRLNRAAKTMNEAFRGYRFNDATSAAYEYFWNDFCDWYVEASKLSMKHGDDAEKDRATTVLLDLLYKSLKLLQPLLPFVTEEIYGKLKDALGGPVEKGYPLLINAPYPQYDPSLEDAEANAGFGLLQDVVRQIRTLRSECTVAPEKKITVQLSLADKGKKQFFGEQSELVMLLANLDRLDLEAPSKHPAGSIALVGSGWEAFVFLAGAVDMAQLKAKFSKELEKSGKFIAGLKAKLSNPQFTGKAPPELVAGEQAKLKDAEARSAKLQEYIQDMAAAL
jgi:valyl-tRNA synthetase